MTTLARAIKEERWDLAALLLLQALLEVAEKLPKDAIPQLLGALEGEADEQQS